MISGNISSLRLDFLTGIMRELAHVTLTSFSHYPSTRPTWLQFIPWSLLHLGSTKVSLVAHSLFTSNFPLCSLRDWWQRLPHPVFNFFSTNYKFSRSAQPCISPMSVHYVSKRMISCWGLLSEKPRSLH